MAVLVVADIHSGELAATLNTITAASKLGDVSVLVAGQGCAAMGEAASKVAGVSKVLVADDAAYAHPLAEGMADLVVANAEGYSHILAPATTTGKNILPRVAALLDVAQISEIVEVVSEDTFVRPIYAGNALETVQSTDGVKVITVRGTAFDAAATEGGSAAIENISAAGANDLSSFVGQELSKSERPELTAAKIVISGGWVLPWAPPVRPSMRASCPTTIRSARPARSSPPTSTSRSASRAPSNTWRG